MRLDARAAGRRSVLVYTRHLNSAAQAIWIARPDGTHGRELVRGGIFGSVSPDGRWVAFDRCLATRQECNSDTAPFALFLVSTSAGKPRMLARSVSYPLWSPRSDRIVAVRRNALVSLDLDGHVVVLERSGATAGWSFSPDGKWIAYAKSRQHTRCASELFVVRAAGGDERRLTRGRDIFPVWGHGWIAFSRYPASCAYARRMWRIRPDGSGERPLTAPPPRKFASSGYYGLDPIDWRGDESTLLGGIASEWGAEALRVDVTTGAYRRLGGYAVALSRDGRDALVDSGGGEGPQTIASVALEGGPRHVLAHGDVAFPSWNE